MRLLHLTPGTGSFHCGSCLRDNALIKALRAKGHDALMAPLYLPMITDVDDAGEGAPVKVGGISLYLQQKFPFFHKLPEGIRKWFDADKRLRWAAQHMGIQMRIAQRTNRIRPLIVGEQEDHVRLFRPLLTA